MRRSQIEWIHALLQVQEIQWNSESVGCLQNIRIETTAVITINSSQSSLMFSPMGAADLHLKTLRLSRQSQSQYSIAGGLNGPKIDKGAHGSRKSMAPITDSFPTNRSSSSLMKS
jgi:hypothetical protein